MKRLCMLLLTISIMAGISSCNSVSSRLDRIEKKMNKADQNLDAFTNEDWADLEKEMNELGKDMEKNEGTYTTEEREKANVLVGRYGNLMVKKGGNDVINELKDGVNQLKGLFGADADSTE